MKWTAIVQLFPSLSVDKDEITLVKTRVLFRILNHRSME